MFLVIHGLSSQTFSGPILATGPCQLSTMCLTSFPTIAYWLRSSSLRHFQTHNTSRSFSSYPLSTLWDKVNGFNSYHPYLFPPESTVGSSPLQRFTFWGVFTSFFPWPFLWLFCCCHISMGSPKKQTSSALLTFTCSCWAASAVLLQWKASKTYRGLLSVLTLLGTIAYMPGVDAAQHLLARASRAAVISQHHLSAASWGVP